MLVQLALALRQNHYGGSIKLVNNEPYAPYQRPPLSKAYLKGDGNLAPLAIRPKAFFSEQRIELIPAKAEAIDRGKKRFACPPELSFSMGIEAGEVVAFCAAAFLVSAPWDDRSLPYPPGRASGAAVSRGYRFPSPRNRAAGVSRV
jgi:hypothetical protein